jgi:hypothetical protein
VGYSFTIGEARMEPSSPEEIADGESPGIDVGAEGFARDDAPTFPNDEMTGNSSSRSPGYSVWSDFCEATGLYELFFGPADERYLGLLYQHPGCARLVPAHHATIAAALERWRAAHPGAVPGFPTYAKGADGKMVWGDAGPVLVDTHYDATLARLIWLEWWVRWALANCALPALENS